MRELIRPILLIAGVLAVPLVPFAILGQGFEDRLETWLEGSLSPAMMATAVVGLLAGDLLLPVPSSLVSTVAGRALGVPGATAASWLGLMLGAAIGFGLARWLGRPLALRFSNKDDLARMHALAARFGPFVLVVARPLPVLAEASVLLLGTTDLSWRRFFVPVALANLGIALAYSLLGTAVRLPIALAASLAIPLAATVVARLWLKGNP
ncbi:MAG: VTT domain-containing protein [Pirellulales bacterium]|nr:VTT domain-containing protein [Pirellulales bacterium]